MDGAGYFYSHGTVATAVLDVTSDITALDSSGFWSLVLTYEGHATCVKFADVRTGTVPAGPWQGPDPAAWRSSLSQQQYADGVERIRQHIAAGDMYQGNLCRVLTADVPDPSRSDIGGLAELLLAGNPAPHAMTLSAGGWEIASASPELFLRRENNIVSSAPIKGTGRTAADLTAKDEAENVMIVDLVRNDLSTVCRTGSVHVPALLEVQEHPGLVHLVSTVQGELRHDATWSHIMEGTFPPGSVTGAPKRSAVSILADLEQHERGPYCGAIGWVDADKGQAELAVGIRTFWKTGSQIHFGTGAGITWASDPLKEWDETELKAKRLIGLAAQTWQGEPS